ncbi:hypothetical protein D3C72_1872210 [compost metagenome]
MAIGHDGDDRAELFFLIDAHLWRDRVKHRRVEERSTGFATMGVDHFGAFGLSIRHQ